MAAPIANNQSLITDAQLTACIHYYSQPAVYNTLTQAEKASLQKIIDLQQQTIQMMVANTKRD